METWGYLQESAARELQAQSIIIAYVHDSDYQHRSRLGAIEAWCQEWTHRGRMRQNQRRSNPE